MATCVTPSLRLCVTRLFYAYSSSSTHYCEEIPYRFSPFRNLHAFRKLRKNSLVSPLQLPRNVRNSISQNTIWEKLHSGNKIGTRTTISLLTFLPHFFCAVYARNRALAMPISFLDGIIAQRWDKGLVSSRNPASPFPSSFLTLCKGKGGGIEFTKVSHNITTLITTKRFNRAV